jgi:uncharacterized protein
MKVLVDTTALLALLDRRHAEHEFLRNRFSLELEADTSLVLTNYVALETFAELHRRLGAASLRLFAREVLPAFEIVWVQPDEHALALEMLLASGSKPPSLIDCTSVVVARRLRATQFMTLDERFAQEGFESIC